MIIKDREYEMCPACGRNQLVSECVYGCDWCQKEIALRKHDEYLSAVVFPEPGVDETYRLEFCSWLCYFRKLQEVQCDYFIETPMLSFDNEQEGLRVEDFWQAIKEIAKEL